jgi:hypothetical protein
VGVVTFVLLWQFTSFDLINCLAGHGSSCSASSPSNSSNTSDALQVLPNIPSARVLYNTTSQQQLADSPTTLVTTWAGGPYANFIVITPLFPADYTIFPTPFFPTALSVPAVGLVYAGNFPTPTRAESPLTLCFPTAIVQSLSLTMETNAQDDAGLTFEVGYDPAFERLTWQSNTGTGGGNVTFSGVMAGPFNPSKLINWVPDVRRPMFQSGPNTPWHNVYSATTLWMGNNTWRMYYGGQDLYQITEFDSIYLSTTTDGFLTFGPRTAQITYDIVGGFYVPEVNNGHVTRLAEDSYYMLMTYLEFCPGCEPNEEYIDDLATALSPDGLHWTPMQGGESYTITMADYPLDWREADINGASAPFFNGSGWEMYFGNDYEPSFTLNYATSPNGMNWTWVKNFTVGDPAPRVLNGNNYGSPECIRRFAFNGSDFFFVVYVRVTPEVWFTVTEGSLANNPGEPQVPLFYSVNPDEDYNVVTADSVENGTHLFGVVYGAGGVQVPQLTNNSLWAKWLQRSPQFAGMPRQSGWALGIDSVIMQLPSTGLVTGPITVYDTDNTTVLYTSPNVTVVAGDTFQLSL